VALENHDGLKRSWGSGAVNLTVQTVVLREPHRLRSMNLKVQTIELGIR
jgi:hypothetical protein